MQLDTAEKDDSDICSEIFEEVKAMFSHATNHVTVKYNCDNF
jgi:hypothetical protein